MINGQAVFAGAGEENIFSGLDAVEPAQNLEAVESVAETNAEAAAVVPQQIDLKPKFFRPKKAMRRRSVSIF